MLLKNSLSGEMVTWATKIDVHNRSVFDDLIFGKVFHALEKHGFEFFNTIGQKPSFINDRSEPPQQSDTQGSDTSAI